MSIPMNESGFLSIIIVVGFILFVIVTFFIINVLKKLNKLDDFSALEEKINQIKNSVDKIEPYILSHEQLKIRIEIEIASIKDRLNKIEERISHA